MAHSIFTCIFCGRTMYYEIDQHIELSPRRDCQRQFDVIRRLVGCVQKDLHHAIVFCIMPTEGLIGMRHMEGGGEIVAAGITGLPR
jgi:hypothetical protein